MSNTINENKQGDYIDPLNESNDLFSPQKVAGIVNVFKNDSVAVHNFYNMFSDLAEESTPKIQGAFKEGDHQNCLKAIHALRGSAITAGADKLGDSLFILERKIEGISDLIEMEKQLADSIIIARQTSNQIKNKLDSIMK